MSSRSMLAPYRFGNPMRMSDVKPTMTDMRVDEMELSTEDLLAFEQPTPSKPAPTVAAIAAVEPITVPEPLQPVDVQPAERLRRPRTATVMFMVAGVVGAVAAAISLFIHPPQPAESNVATAIFQQPSVVATTPPEPAAEVQPPVRIVNSFDKSEVFEFPAGTSRDEARAAVADILMKRAMERRDQFAATSTNGR